MDKIDTDQVCAVCGKSYPVREMYLNTLFEEARCKACLDKYGTVQLETLKAEIISVHGLKLKDIPKAKWNELLMLQKKKSALKQETEEKITKVKGSLLNIGRDNKIGKIKIEAAEKRLQISQEIKTLIKSIKEEIPVGEPAGQEKI
jgi:hypothetical protein